MIEVLAAVAAAARRDAVKVNYRCGWCASGLHQKCPGTFDTPAGRTITCVCSLTWRHADIPNLTRRSQ